jgi:hypothetical protein
MLSAQKVGVLQAFLGSLPPHVAQRLSKAVEVDRLADGKSLPHDLILDGLRPVLRANERHDRMPTPLRLFCSPFEDLLVNQQRGSKQKGRIARSHIGPVWQWLSTLLIPKEAHDYEHEVKALIVSLKTDEARTRAMAFWQEASAAMRNALELDKSRKIAHEALRDRLALADAEEMALLLAVGPDILVLQEKLPKPVPAFTEDLVRAARQTYDHFIATAPDAAPYVAVAAMNRLSRRWEALRLPVLISRKAQDTLISSTDMGLAGELLFSDIDALSHAIRSTKQPRFDVDEMIDYIASFAELSSAIVKEMAVRRDGKWGQSLLKDRAEVGNVMDDFMERAPKEIAAALPMQKSGGRFVDPERNERALRYATLISGCKPFASAGSFAASREDAHKGAAEYLRRYNEEALYDLRTTNMERRQLAKDRFALASELTAILCGEEEAELLRRRGRAANAA